MKPMPLLSWCMCLGRHRDVGEKEHGERDGGMCSLNSGLSWTPSDGFLWCLCKARGSSDGCGCKRLKLWQVFVKWTLLPLKKVVFPKGIHLWKLTKARRSVREERSPVPAVPLVYRGKDTGADEPDVERLLLSWKLDESQKLKPVKMNSAHFLPWQQKSILLPLYLMLDEILGKFKSMNMINFIPDLVSIASCKTLHVIFFFFL